MAKHRQLDSQGFPPPYAKALKIGTISASRLAIARSAITLRASYPGESHLGAFWWIMRGISTVFTTLKSDLRPTLGFMRSPATYRGDDSFLLAEARTHWTAQKYLDVDVLLPVERYPHFISLTPAGTAPPKSMPKGYRSPRKNAGAKSAPDFIGLGGKVHVLESKGRANFGVNGVTDAVKTAARNKALHQVCRVGTVNGAIPATRTACVFSFESTTLSGWIDDPPETERLHLRMETVQLLREYYAIVLDPAFQELLGDRAASVGSDRRDFVGIDFAPGWRLSIDREVMDAVRNLETPASGARLLAILRQRRAEFGDRDQPQEGSSVGPDGLRLDGPPGFELPPLRKGRRG